MCLLIAPAPVHCFSITFKVHGSKSLIYFDDFVELKKIHAALLTMYGATFKGHQTAKHQFQ